MTRPFRHTRLVPSSLVGITALALAATAPVASGRDHRDKEIPFDEAEIFFELNNTDGDLGIHGKVDGGPWTYITIEDSKERELMHVKTKTHLRRQAVTELFFESAEPTFDELSPKRFFRRFPQGTYEIEGKSQDGKELESETEVTHTMPAPPETSVNGEEEAMQCDDEEPGYDAPTVEKPVTIAWNKVEMSHPDLGNSGVPVEIVNYEVVVETEVELNGDEFEAVLSVILPPDQTSFEVPYDFIALSDTFKYEILAREESYNQTATESCFEVFEVDGD